MALVVQDTTLKRPHPSHFFYLRDKTNYVTPVKVLYFRSKLQSAQLLCVALWHEVTRVGKRQLYGGDPPSLVLSVLDLFNGSLDLNNNHKELHRGKNHHNSEADLHIACF